MKSLRRQPAELAGEVLRKQRSLGDDLVSKG